MKYASKNLGSHGLNVDGGRCSAKRRIGILRIRSSSNSRANQERTSAISSSRLAISLSTPMDKLEYHTDMVRNSQGKNRKQISALLLWYEQYVVGIGLAMHPELVDFFAYQTCGRQLVSSTGTCARTRLPRLFTKCRNFP